ncbi:hypothetical protein ARMSODRAFT_1029164 [Armillaria solidipes]|uniref:Ribonucleotide reductase large subunit C-terminal domain-containing protein n=1 Tax=Armillaria solidipes TaxID=1076256 RepID=A0A2H3C7H0_9AGAR|nr:hypothetical protein ARMSODRAFT_1029164 [Armillaria solidipes]
MLTTLQSFLLIPAFVVTLSSTQQCSIYNQLVQCCGTDVVTNKATLKVDAGPLDPSKLVKFSCSFPRVVIAQTVKYEKEGHACKSVPAQKLWHAILDGQVETGNPFMVYKDAANASLALPTFMSNGAYDFKKLHAVAKTVTFNLNRIIDANYYPVPEARCPNF